MAFSPKQNLILELLTQRSYSIRQIYNILSETDDRCSIEYLRLEMSKLVNLHFVEKQKIAENIVIYVISEKGKELNY